MFFTTARRTAHVVASNLAGNGPQAGLALHPLRLTPPSGTPNENEPQARNVPADVARAVLPAVAASVAIVLGPLALKQTRPALTLKVARFANLGLASLMAGNGVGSALFVQPALGSLPDAEYFRSEQALVHSYGDAMRALMPATVASCLALLGQIRDRRSAAFRLTLAGTAGFVGMLATTARELPINIKTAEAPPESPPTGWLDQRADWNRFNQLRTVFEVAGWTCLCLAALSER